MATPQATSSRDPEAAAILLRSIFDSSADGMIVITDDGTITEFNPGATRLFGYVPDQVVGKNVKMLMPEPYHSEHDGYLEHHLSTGEQRIIGIGREVEGRRKDGTTFPMHLSVSAFVVRGQRLFAGIAHDITRQADAVAARVETAALLRSIVDSAVDGLITIDVDGSIMSFNPAAARLFGYTPDEVMGQNVKMLMPEPYHSEHDGYLEHHLSTGEQRIIGIGREVEGRRKDGTTFPMHLSVGRFEADGKPMFTGIAHDISDRRRVEAEHDAMEAQLGQAQRLESLGQLAGGIAHDFNNILAAMAMYAEMAIEATEPESALRRDIEQIAAAADQGRGLTQQLLTFARRDLADVGPLDVNEVVRSVNKLLQRTLGEQVRLKTALAPELSHVRADRSQVEQVLVNLSVNARDAMPRGGQLTIETSNVEVDDDYARSRPGLEPGRYVQIAVSDDGDGMPEEVRLRAFEPFFTTKPTGAGTGLGLATVYGVVHQVGGSVGIYSEPGAGTVVRVYLPAIERPEPVEAADQPMEPPVGHGETVLVVEDAGQIRPLVERILRSAGYEVIAAADGAEALAALRSFEGVVTVLLTDVVMPGMSGPELAVTVLAEQPETGIVFMSGYTGGIIAAHGVAQGATLLEKPFTRAQLLAAVGKAVTP